MSRNRTIFTLVLATLLLAAVPAAADKGWQTQPQRGQSWVNMANHLRLRKVPQKAVDALNRAYGTKLTPDRVRIVSFTHKRKFWSFVDKAKGRALGMVVTPHGTGPHPHLLVGDKVYDGIQPGWKNNGVKATFRDGTMMRKDSFGNPHGSRRIFCLFNAPKASIQGMEAHAEKMFHAKRNVGYNCAAFVTDAMIKESTQTKGSPFGRVMSTWSPQSAVNSIMKARPDMIIQVMPEHEYQKVKQDPNHLVRFWGQQRL